MAAGASSLWNAFNSRLSDEDRVLLRAVLEVAAGTGVQLFLVGGSVRDLILDRQGLDIDIAVEGDIDAFVPALAETTARRLVRHGRFGTASLRTEGASFDFARTRRETYPRPGALPEVEPAGIGEDLARRDFTVNAMALRLTAPRGELLDPHRGQSDLERRLVRVLHDRSFQDDATRMLRACRYAARLGFDLEAGTRRSLGRDLAYVATVSGARLRRELSLAFRDASAVEAASLAAGLGVLEAVHPLLSLDARVVEAWREALRGERYGSVEELGFCVVSSCRSEADVAALSARLHLTGRLESAVAGLVRLQALSDKLDAPDADPAAAVEVFERFPPSTVWAFALKMTGQKRELAFRFLRHWRRVKVSLNGFDLQALGLAPGPRVGAALRRLRQARLRGEVSSREEEVALVEREYLA